MRKDYSLAELRYYEKTKKGITVSDTLSYVFIEKEKYLDENTYKNVFNDESFPIVRRQQVNGEDYYYYFVKFDGNLRDKNGLCWVLTDVSIKNLPLKDLENIVIYSDYYFKDRKELVDERIANNYTSSIIATVISDANNYEKMTSFLKEKGLDYKGKKLVR